MRTRIRLLFLAAIVSQPLQYLITAKSGEPYPALMLPGFGGTMADRDGNIRFRNVKCKVLFQDGRVDWISAYTLLSEAPSSHHGVMMAHMFSPPPAKADSRPMNTLKARLFPGRTLSHIRQEQKELDPQTKEWLKRRIQVLYPSQRCEGVTFVWFDDVFNVKRAPPAITHEPAGVREVRFE
jgi:hypothetical protein